MSGLEIERKFLVKGTDYRRMATTSSHIRQGYICSDSGRTVRVRQRDDKAYLTIKGPSRDGGLTRYEFEHEISLDEATELFSLCEPGGVDKTRWLVPSGSHVFEVDEFHGDNEGLVVAEVEMRSDSDPLELPPFIGEEVTGDRRYYNSQLTKKPYRQW